MNGWLESLRWLYNTALIERRNNWRYKGRSVRAVEQCASLPELRKRKHAFAAVHSQVLQDVVFRLDKAFVAFFRRSREGNSSPGYPRCKSEGRYRSFTYPQATAFRILEGQKKIKLGKLGNIRLRYHRPLAGVPKTATVVRYASGKWYVCISCRLPDVPLVEASITGFDLGLANYLASSEGAAIKPLKALRRSEKKLRKEQRKLSRKMKGSSRRRKQRQRLAKTHERIANQRSDFLHKTSRRVVDSHAGLAFEKLRVENMLKSRKLAKAISDAGWAKFVDMVAYKAERAGKPFVLVDARNTTQDCSGCGARVPKDLSTRIHACPECALVLDRDVNAAINVASRAGAVLRYARGEATAVDAKVRP